VNILEIKNVSVSFEHVKRASRLTFKQELLASLTRKRPSKQLVSGTIQALKEISFNLMTGQRLGVIGPNGSGKSTLLRVIGGIYAPDSGEVIRRGSISTLLSLGAGFQGELSGIDNIYINGLFAGLTKKEVDRKLVDIVDFSELYEFIEDPVKTYSSGMRARLGFSISLFVKRNLMLIDEVLGVGDKTFRAKSKTALLELISEDRSFVVVSHNMATIRELTDMCLWLEKGEMRILGPTEEVVAGYEKS